MRLGGGDDEGGEGGGGGGGEEGLEEGLGFGPGGTACMISVTFGGHWA